GRFVEPGDAVEDGGLACPVGADDGGDLAPVGAEGEIVDSDEAAEAHGQVLYREQGDGRRGHHPCPSPTTSARTMRRSRRKMEGARKEMSPRGFQIISSTIPRPNSSIRYCVGSKSGPNTRFSQSSSRRISVPPIITNAAMATPIWLPMPPMTTIASTTALSMKV